MSCAKAPVCFVVRHVAPDNQVLLPPEDHARHRYEGYCGFISSAVFVGRYGYPKMDIGPLVSAEFGDTLTMNIPEKWDGKSIDDIVDFRFRLVRGKYCIDVRDFEKAGRIVMDNKVQPFGSSARMEGMRKSNGRWERNLEKGFYDTDEGAVNAVLDTYRKVLSDI